MGRKAVLSAIVLCAVLLVVITVYLFKVRDTANDWSRYISPQLGVSFEYPSGRLTVRPEGSFGTTTIRIDNQSEIADPQKQEIIIFEIVPTDPKKISSLEDWIQFVGHNDSPGGSPYVNGRFVKMNGERAVITTQQDSNEVGLDVFHKNTLYSMFFQNMSTADIERVWKSVVFLNN